MRACTGDLLLRVQWHWQYRCSPLPFDILGKVRFLFLAIPLLAHDAKQLEVTFRIPRLWFISGSVVATVLFFFVILFCDKGYDPRIWIGVNDASNTTPLLVLLPTVSGEEVPHPLAAHAAWHRVLLLVVKSREYSRSSRVLNQVVVIALSPFISWQL
jgi:hypothetical protein